MTERDERPRVSALSAARRLYARVGVTRARASGHPFGHSVDTRGQDRMDTMDTQRVIAGKGRTTIVNERKALP